ncbi:hypothetical protein K3169_08885 [Pseudomonas phytophila]|uniref:Uncharacterized protein n=1 Tax=Pseudomonas phytophila TaxID=2867264 RepID=A0ABY6FJ91_9PSED|nr:hypothetical protein [Pseudomonas phytophila]MCQ2996634.1 hypothetical protein [Pseudomonas syringae]MDG6403694.1 hypothetical protein [Pseudomonas quasicaspiana]MCQ3000553.1 hypothetical protein [Pseudomonas syringae]MCQ3032182.1 hypothetical protein [Pseudomonas syringae]UXZ97976.1 hypothetical protein K3169_08885 [Pseudomonas phytophila]
MGAFFSTLLPILAGMLLLCIGYSYQERNSGVFMIWLGMIGILGTVVFKILEKLS